MRLDELVRFEHGQVGFATTLDRDLLGCVLLDETEAVEAGDLVRGTGEVVRVPVGRGAPRPRRRSAGPPARRRRHDRGRQRTSPIERPAPAIIDRDFVSEPVQTGLLVIDSMFALGRGQRELIIGDRAIGKTAIAVDCIINQKSSDIICVYVAVGQKSSTVKRVIDAVQTPRRAGALHLRRRQRVGCRPACNGSRRLPASPWRNISATAASTRWSSSTT